MTLPEFMRLFELVGNTTWARYYLSSYPGQMVLEIADLDGAGLGSLPQELADKGFSLMDTIQRAGVPCALFAVYRKVWHESRD